MATEIGGIKLGYGQLLTDPLKAGASEQAIADFFKGIVGEKPTFTDFGTSKGAHSYEAAGKKVSVYESGNKAKLKAGEASVISGGGTKKVIGSKGDDKVLVTDSLNHKLTLDKGNDTVVLAGTGSNTVDGGKGNDTIVSGAGNDTMTGGKGNDTFVFNNGPTGNDLIKDFKKGDVLKIMDRNGDHKVDSNDYSIAQNGKNTVITLKGEGGGTITLKKVDSTKLVEDKTMEGQTPEDDGIFHL